MPNTIPNEAVVPEYAPEAWAKVNQFVETEMVPLVEVEMTGVTLISIDQINDVHDVIANELLSATGKKWKVNQVTWTPSNLHNIYVIAEYHAVHMPGIE